MSTTQIPVPSSFKSRWLARKNAGRSDAVTQAPNHMGRLAGLANNTNPTWYKDPCMRKMMCIIAVLTFCSINNGFDGSLINNLQALETWKADFDHPDANMLGLIGASITLGSWAGTPLVPIVMDRYGRRWAILVGALINGSGGLIQTFSYSRPQYIVGRMITGAGTMFAIIAGNTLINEIAHPRLRYKIVGFFQITWYIGSFVAAWLCYGLRLRLPNSTWQWRLPTLLQLFWAGMMVLGFCLSPESPRYLIAKGRDVEARDMLLKHHANGAEEDELVSGLIAEISDAFAFEKAHKGKTWKQCFSTPGKQVEDVYNNWSIGLFPLDGPTNRFILQRPNSETGWCYRCSIPTGHQRWSIHIRSVLCSRRLHPFQLCGPTTLIPHVVFGSVGDVRGHHRSVGPLCKTHIPGYGYAAIAFFWLNSGFWNSAMNPIAYAYLGEVHSYSTRAKGLSLYLFCIDLQSVVIRYVNPVGLANLQWRFYLVYLSFYFFQLTFMYLYLPETKGRSLEEVAEIFDGPRAHNEEVTQLEAAMVSDKEKELGNSDDFQDQVQHLTAGMEKSCVA